MNKILFIFINILCLNFIFGVELKPIITRDIKDERFEKIIIDKDDMYLIKYANVINFQFDESKQDGKIIVCDLNENIKKRIDPYKIYGGLLGLILGHDNIYNDSFSIINGLFVFSVVDSAEDKEDKTEYLIYYDKESRPYVRMLSMRSILSFYCKNNEIFFIARNYQDIPGLYKYNIIKKGSPEKIVESNEMFYDAVQFSLYADDNSVFMTQEDGAIENYDIKTKDFKRLPIWKLLEGKTDVSKIVKETQRGNGACFYFNNGKYYRIYPLLNKDGNSDEAIFIIYNIHDDRIETCFNISYGYTVYPRKMYYPNSNMKQYWRYIGPSDTPFDTSDGGKEDTISNPLKMAVDDQGYIYIFDNYLSRLTKYELITDENKGRVKKYYTPTVTTLRFREAPLLEGKYIRTLKKGERLELLERGKEETIDKIKGSWIKVRTDQGETGWCFDGYLEEVK